MSFLTVFWDRTFHSARTEIIMSKNEIHTKYFLWQYKDRLQITMSKRKEIGFFSIIRYKDGITSYTSNILPSESQLPQVTISISVYSLLTVFYA